MQNLRFYLSAGLALLISYSVYCFILLQQNQQNINKAPENSSTPVVVLPPALQILAYAGDRYLAANIEVTRIVVDVDSQENNATLDSYAKLLSNASSLNPCHYDNYYMANSILPWAGLYESAEIVLRRAANCRQWDEFASFYYAVLVEYFAQDTSTAVQYLNHAATVAPKKSASAYKRMAIQYQSRQYKNDQQAMTFLKWQLEQASDPKLQLSLKKSIQRLEGLMTLKSAQQKFTQNEQRPLQNPKELITHGYLASFPVDPRNIGYTFDKGQFFLAQRALFGKTND